MHITEHLKITSLSSIYLLLIQNILVRKSWRGKNSHHCYHHSLDSLQASGGVSGGIYKNKTHWRPIDGLSDQIKINGKKRQKSIFSLVPCLDRTKFKFTTKHIYIYLLQSWLFLRYWRYERCSREFFFFQKISRKATRKNFFTFFLQFVTTFKVLVNSIWITYMVWFTANILRFRRIFCRVMFTLRNSFIRVGAYQN